MIIRVVGNGRDRSLQDVTIEPNDRRYPFCKILNENIILSKIGKIIDEQWRWLFSRYAHIKMDEYIIMPDHFHGIIRILANHQNRFDLSHIIGAFNTTASKRIHQAGYHNFKWKRSFHDRIIRQDKLEIKRAYIRNNPKKLEREVEIGRKDNISKK